MSSVSPVIIQAHIPSHSIHPKHCHYHPRRCHSDVRLHHHSCCQLCHPSLLFLFRQVSAPVWNRDFFYLNGKLGVVRDYMRENCVQTVAEDLLALALDIFSRCEV